MLADGDDDDDDDKTTASPSAHFRQRRHLFLLLLHGVGSVYLFDSFCCVCDRLAVDKPLSFLAYKPDIIKRCLPNLHSLGELLLPCFLRQLFTLTVLLSLYVLYVPFERMDEILLRLCLLVSYALAGSQAFATLFHVK